MLQNGIRTHSNFRMTTSISYSSSYSSSYKKISIWNLSRRSLFLFDGVNKVVLTFERHWWYESTSATRQFFVTSTSWKTFNGWVLIYRKEIFHHSHNKDRHFRYSWNWWSKYMDHRRLKRFKLSMINNLISKYLSWWALRMFSIRDYCKVLWWS